MKKLLILLLLLLNIQLVIAGDVNFSVTNAETTNPIEGATIVLNGATNANYSEIEITDTNGEATFQDVSNYALYSVVVVHADYESYSDVIWVDGEENIDVELTPTGDYAWSDLEISDGNARITWHANDDDTLYNGGERMNYISTTTNIRSSGYIVFDSTTPIFRSTYYSDGTLTDWSSVHTPSPDEIVELKPTGWISTTFEGDEAIICIKKAIVHSQGMVIDLTGDEMVCQTEIRNENMIPYYLDGELYIETNSSYRIGSTHYPLTVIPQNFFISNGNSSENHPPLLNYMDPDVLAEGEIAEVEPIAMDPDNDTLIVTLNDSRFLFTVQQGNTFSFVWQTDADDAGVYSVEVTVSDGEFDVFGYVNITVLEAITIELNEGLNLVSFPLANVVVDINYSLVLNDSISLQTFDIHDSLELVSYFESGEWLWYAPSSNNPTLLSFNETQSAWLNMSAPRTLRISGVQRYPIQFTIHEGLNMIGYPSLSSGDPVTVMGGVYGTYESLITYDNDEWLFFNPDAPPMLNNLQDMMPGQGFWILANQDMVWEFDGTGFSMVSSSGVSQPTPQFSTDELLPPPITTEEIIVDDENSSYITRNKTKFVVANISDYLQRETLKIIKPIKQETKPELKIIKAKHASYDLSVKEELVFPFVTLDLEIKQNINAFNPKPESKNTNKILLPISHDAKPAEKYVEVKADENNAKIKNIFQSSFTD